MLSETNGFRQATHCPVAARFQGNPSPLLAVCQ